MELAVRVLAADFEEIVNLVQPENCSNRLGELWDVSGFPLSWSPDALTSFLAVWEVGPVKSFRQRYRRTGVVRAADDMRSCVINGPHWIHS